MRYAPLRELVGDAAYFLDRPSDQERRFVRGRGRVFLTADVAVPAVPGAGFVVHAFMWLIVAPFLLAGVVQARGRRNSTGARIGDVLGLLPVPATAVVLFIVVCSVVPQLDVARASAIQAVPIYLAFAILAPCRFSRRSSSRRRFIELLSELVYVRFMPKVGKDPERQKA